MEYGVMDVGQYKQRETLINVFLQKNSQINLSAVRDASGVYQKHIVDSLELLKVLEKQSNKDIEKIFSSPGKTLLDIGTGGGFPLLPLAMSFPHISCTGIDARRKKIEAVREMVQQLSVKNVDLIRERVENHKKTYDIVTARSVAYVDKLFARSRNILKPGSLFLLYKMFTHEEDDALLRLIREKHFEVMDIHHYTLPHDTVPRVLYILRKTS